MVLFKAIALTNGWNPKNVVYKGVGGRDVYHAHKDTPNSRGVFNRILPIRKTSTTWPSEFANSALTDWVGLFSHHDNGELPH